MNEDEHEDGGEMRVGMNMMPRDVDEDEREDEDEGEDGHRDGNEDEDEHDAWRSGGCRSERGR